MFEVDRPRMMHAPVDLAQDLQLAALGVDLQQVEPWHRPALGQRAQGEALDLLDLQVTTERRVQVRRNPVPSKAFRSGKSDESPSAQSGTTPSSTACRCTLNISCPPSRSVRAALTRITPSAPA